MAHIIGNRPAPPAAKTRATPARAALADRRPLPPWAGRRRVTRYFCGVMQSVNDWSPNRNVPQFPDTDRSSNAWFGPKVSPSAIV
jgi:hypothetical protein